MACDVVGSVVVGPWLRSVCGVSWSDPVAGARRNLAALREALGGMVLFHRLILSCFCHCGSKSIDCIGCLLDDGCQSFGNGHPALLNYGNDLGQLRWSWPLVRPPAIPMDITPGLFIAIAPGDAADATALGCEGQVDGGWHGNACE